MKIIPSFYFGVVLNNKYSSKEILCILAIEGLIIIMLLAVAIMIYRPAKQLNKSYINTEPILDAERQINNKIVLSEEEKEYLSRQFPEDIDNINKDILTEEELDEIKQYRILKYKLTEKYPNTLIEPTNPLNTEGISVGR